MTRDEDRGALEQVRREAEAAARREREALREVERAERRAVLLAEASSVLSASLDYDTTLRTLARLCVARLSDWAYVYVANDAGEVRRVELAHSDPRQEDLARDLRVYPFDPTRCSPVRAVLQTGQPTLLPTVDGAALEASAVDEAHERLLRELGVCSAMVVPLVARGRTIGALALLTAESRRVYTEKDLAVAEELARRAALALDNAQLFQQAQEAARAKSDFLAVMSHELRTPLNAIMGYTDLLLMGLPQALPDPSASQVERIGASARHLLHLIEEILAFSRIQAGEEEVNREPVELYYLVKDVAAGIRPLAEAKRVEFRVAEPSTRLIIETDAGKLKQTLINVLANAIKFTSAGSVAFRVEEKPDTILFEVSDTGIGLSEEYLESIFEPFFQVEAASTRRVGGTGLGLTISRRFARLLGGELGVSSAGPGAGSVFRLEIPRTAPVRAHARPRVKQKHRGSPAAIVD